MSSSLAGEVSQLYELFKLGALTQAEFDAAKQAAIRNFSTVTVAASSSAGSEGPSTGTTAHATASPSTQPVPHRREEEGTVHRDCSAPSTIPASATPAPSKPAPLHARSMVEWKQLWDTTPLSLPPTPSSPSASPLSIHPDAVDVRMQALRCLARLLRNVVTHPTELKYRRLREDNKIITQEVMPVAGASMPLLRFAGFLRGRDEGKSEYHWELRGDADAACRTVQAALDVVEQLLTHLGEQQSRRLGVQQLWRSVALEVRLERAARASANGEPQRLCDLPSESEDEDVDVAAASRTVSSPPAAHPLLAYLLECYTVDEGGDNLSSPIQNLRTLEQLYGRLVVPHTEGGTTPEGSPAPPTSSSSPHSLISSAEMYNAIIRQRGAIELLYFACGARFSPPLSVPQRESGASAPANASAPSASEADLQYTVQLIPKGAADVPSFAACCTRLLRRLRRAVERVQLQRTDAARRAAEASMRQELKRERQRLQLERQHQRDKAAADEQAPQHFHRRARVQPSTARYGTLSSSSSSCSSTPTHTRHGESRNNDGSRIPLAEAVAILMGKRSPPAARPPPTDTP